MLFNSYIFIFLFLPIALFGYYILTYFKFYRTSRLFLTGMSLWFYGYFNPLYLIIICGSIVANYLVTKEMELLEEEHALKKFILICGICGNMAAIFYFKYYNFFLKNVNILFGKSFGLRNIILPLGISFFTFQQISYLIDSYRGGENKRIFF